MLIATTPTPTGIFTLGVTASFAGWQAQGITTVASAPEWFQMVIQGGALTIVMLVVHRMFWHIWPQMIKSFEAERDTFLKQLNHMRTEDFAARTKQLAAQQENTGTLKEMQRLLINHDAQVRGVNPDVTGVPLSEIRRREHKDD